MADGTRAIPLWLAIIIGLLSSLVQSLGLSLQRKSHLLTSAQPAHLQRPTYKHPLWLVGFAIFISSNVVGTVFQVGALPIVVLAPLGAVSLLYNSLFAKFLLGDVFTRWMGVGTVLITTGAILIATFGVVEEPLLELEELLRLFARKEWWIFSSLVGVGTAVALAVCHTIEHLMNRRLASYGPIHLPHDDELSPSTPLTKLPSINDPAASSAPTPSVDQTARTKLYLALAYSFVSGTLSGLCLLFAKTGVELLLSTLSSRKSQFSTGTVVFGGGGLIILALAQLYYLNHALRLDSPTIVCPVAFSAYNVSSVFGGLVYFDQISQLTGVKLSLVGVGVTVLLLGVGAVSVGGCGKGECKGGGVGVGVWVEEEDVDLSDDEQGERDEEYFGQAPYSDEPASTVSPSSHSSPPSPTPDRRPRPSLPSILTSPESQRPPRRSSTTHSHARYLPFSPTMPSSPSSPNHTTSSTQHQHPQSTGLFSIGLGAASPGFFVVGRQHARGGSVDGGGGGSRRKSEVGKSGLGLGVVLSDEEEGVSAAVVQEGQGSSSALVDES